ncbi:MAG: hypothetical protein IH588_06760 [Anaerolineales bacterium]|nr:hypothetical protein [Anaerolineales bacterium]
MAISKSRSEAQTLENYRVALENVETQTEVAQIMADFGYDSAAVAEGKELLGATRTVFDLHHKEDEESNLAKDDLNAKLTAVRATYSLHRKKAKTVFRKSEAILQNLGLTGSIPDGYIKFLESLKTFYTRLQEHADWLAKLAPLKVLPEDITAALAAITQLEAARATYLREIGESQDATEAKDKAFARMDEWMREFRDVARIALEDRPQLLESINIFVRN